MKITIICEVLGEKNNGTTIAAYNLIDYLKSKGHEVTVVCPDEDKRGEDGYFILPKANYGKIINKILEKNNVVLTSFDNDIVYNAIKDADVVHIMIPLFIARRTSKLVKKLGIPLTAGFHAQAENFSAHIGLMRCGFVNKILYKWYYGNLYCRADAIHYPTQFIQDVFENVIKKKTNGYVISNGVNSSFKPMEVEKPTQYKNKFCILFTGRFSKEKSHMVLLKAVARSKYNDVIQLFFAGQGGEQKKCEKYARKHLKNQPVIGFYSREDLVKLINSCDLYCHPARVEIEAIACTEAISCGLVPLIANSPSCATKSFALDERCLFKVDSPKDLCEKIEYFIENPTKKEKLKQKYLKESTAFDQNYCMKQMEKMLISVANESKKNAKRKTV